MGYWVLVGIVVGSIWYYWFNSSTNNKNKQKKEKGKKNQDQYVKDRPQVPKGRLGWPLIGETLDFIACGYTSRPVSFMENRTSL